MCEGVRFLLLSWTPEGMPVNSSAFPTRWVPLNQPVSWQSPGGLLIWPAPTLHVDN